MLKDWDDYYINHFDKYKQKIDVRDGCQPQIFRHGDENRNAIVLVHGLTDSPYFMKDIGEYFCSEMGFDVYIPLLQAHGLKDPNGMQGVSAQEWKRNIKFAIQEAKKSGGKLSIGGFSTGGTLSVEQALSDKDSIDGGIFLFSAALGLATSIGDIGEVISRTPAAKLLDYLNDVFLNTNLIDDSPSGNPYRYSKMDLGAVTQLSHLIKEIEDYPAENKSVTQPLFVAHSEADVVADINELKKLITHSSKSDFFRIGKGFSVSHSSLVLKKPVFSLNNSPLEPQNPFFIEMMESVKIFTNKYKLT
jgi:esterase/lipase